MKPNFFWGRDLLITAATFGRLLTTRVVTTDVGIDFEMVVCVLSIQLLTRVMMYFSYLEVQWDVINSATRKNGGKYYCIKQSNTQLVMLSSPCRGI